MRRSTLVGIALASLACGKAEHPPAPHAGFELDAGDDDAVTFDVGTTDAAINCAAGSDAGLCACEEIGQKPTSLYLVLDGSGSMAEPASGTLNKWQTIVLALLDDKTGVLRGLGSRVSLGVAVFPGASATEGCVPGDEVMPLTVGSKKTYDTLRTALAGVTPLGATPTAATLRALDEKVKALPSPAYVLLATDGAPNCGTEPCSIDRCSYNIERVPLSGGGTCDATINCCDPAKVMGLGWQACVDSTATKEAVANLAAAGIKVFVLGIPGSGPYSADLDELAQAGNTAREDALPGEPLYYAASASTQEAFATALKAVAAKVIDSCVITLEAPPKDPGITNVVVDGTLVPQDPVDGWTWTSDGKVELHGATCNRVKSGLVSNVQVAVGCKTITK